MKSGPFIKMIAQTFLIEEKTVTVYARVLKEAGLLTSGARGVNAPDMTPLDAARMTIALLASDGPSQAVERVQQFGRLGYSPKVGDDRGWREIIGSDEFANLFPDAEALEDVLAFIFSRYLDLGLDRASVWFGQHMLSLMIRPGDVLAELVQWISNDKGKITSERTIPFKGNRLDPDYVTIPRGLLVERTATPGTMSLIASSMWAATKGEG